MAGPLRLEFPGAVYHVTSRGNARQDIVQTIVIARSSSPCSPMLLIAIAGCVMPTA
jgi:hypothetical protein